MNNISARIRKIRESGKQSQTDFAKMLGLSKQTISNYETGARQPGLDIIMNIAEKFSISTDYILGKSEHETIDDAILHASMAKSVSIKLNENFEFVDFITKVNTCMSGNVNWSLLSDMIDILPEADKEKIDEYAIRSPYIHKLIIEKWLKESYEKLINYIDFEKIEENLQPEFDKIAQSLIRLLI